MWEPSTECDKSLVCLTVEQFLAGFCLEQWVAHSTHTFWHEGLDLESQCSFWQLCNPAILDFICSLL